MTTGRVLAVSLRSASQISPGWGFIDQVEDLLFGSARPRDIKDVVIGEFDNLGDALSGFCRRLRLPLAQSSVQFLRQGVHDRRNERNAVKLRSLPRSTVCAGQTWIKRDRRSSIACHRRNPSGVTGTLQDRHRAPRLSTSTGRLSVVTSWTELKTNPS